MNSLLNGLREVLENIRETISAEYSQIIQKNYESNQTGPFKCVRQDPEIDDMVSDIGQLREFIKDVDLYKKLKISQYKSLASAFLGELAGGSFSQMTVHTGDLSKADTKSYTFLVPKNLLNSVNLEHFDIVEFKIRAYCVPGVKVMWLCDSIKSPI